MTPLLESLRSSFSALPVAVVDAGGLGDLRRSAMLEALAQGLPGPRSERWKYTALRALSARPFVAESPTPRLHPAVLDDIPAPRLVFVNGRLDEALSLIGELPAGVSVSPLSVALGAGSAIARQLFEPRFDQADEGFSRFNTALANEGALLGVAAGCNVETPLHLVFVGAPAEQEIASHARHAIMIGDGARACVIEHHIAIGPQRHLANHLMQVRLGEAARLTHARTQDEDAGATLIARTDIELGRDASYQRVDLELGAALSRHELDVSLQGDRAAFSSAGALLSGGRRHLDTRVTVEHIGRDTRCELLWRGLAADRARVAFHGGIKIHEGADGSDARLSNKNLLLSENAEIDTQPVLEINADEVKAAHGATVGRLDETSLFYLRSRGIPVVQARAMLTLAFCREALASVGDLALIESLSPRLEAQLAKLETVA